MTDPRVSALGPGSGAEGPTEKIMTNTNYSDQMLALLSPATRAAVLERAEQIEAREREHARLVAEREAREARR